MQKTKIEVLLDKMHLVVEEADAELDAVDQQLLSKYARQMMEMMQQNGGNEAAAQLGHEQEQTKAPRDTKPAPEEKVQPPKNESPATGQDAEPGNNRPQVNPLTDQQSKASELSFIDDKDEPEPSAAEKKHNQPTTEERGGVNKGHEDIYRNLEEIRKNREAGHKFVDEDGDEDDDNTEPGQDEPSLNDRFKQTDADIVDHLKGSPIKNLQREIDLNDKFWFINELFEGDASTFNNLLKELDALQSFEDAKQKMDELAGSKYGWSDGDHAAAKFYQVVRRRYL